jgi:hypothetical protein
VHKIYVGFIIALLIVIAGLGVQLRNDRITTNRSDTIIADLTKQNSASIQRIAELQKLYNGAINETSRIKADYRRLEANYNESRKIIDGIRAGFNGVIDGLNECQGIVDRVTKIIIQLPEADP